MNAEQLKRTTRLLERLFHCFPQSALANVDAQMRGYLDAVKDCDVRDVESAVGMFQRGEVDVDRQFCPSSAVLCAEIRRRALVRRHAEGGAAQTATVIPILPKNHFQNRKA
jgi:hypothetical protein